MIPDAQVVVIECVHCSVGGGRRPRGLCSPGTAIEESPGGYFASMAHLESASVRAFRDLERFARRARRAASPRARRPSRRVRRAPSRAGPSRGSRAASEARRRVHGCVAALPPTIFELLEDGVVEGCVGETFGALLLTWQAEHAADPRVRRTMRAITLDETRHAALAWEVWAWGAELLGPGERAALRRTLDRALAALEGSVLQAAPPAVQRVAGYPPPDVARGPSVRGLARLARGGSYARVVRLARRRGPGAGEARAGGISFDLLANFTRARG